MPTVLEVLHSKPVQVTHAVSPTTPLHDAAKLMMRENIGALVIIERGNVIGLVTERDVVRKVVAEGLSPIGVTVGDIMATRVRFVKPDQSPEDCMAIMTEARARHLLVMDEGRLLGLISIGDLVKDIISEQRHVITQLEHYITNALI